MAMLPKRERGGDTFDGFDIAAILEPARSVGGDLYNYFSVGDDRLLFAVGDVSDKGVPAALFMVKTNTLLRSVAGEIVELSTIMARVNQELSRENEACMFVTLIVGILDLNTGDFALANGGHNAPVLMKADGSCAYIETETGPALGFDESGEFPVMQSRLNPGEMLLLYTDGVTEAFNDCDEMYSDERLVEVLAGQAQSGAADTTQMLLRSVQDFAGDHGQSDDITIVALRNSGN
ncbi:MAG: PP2C family protein-serine/threonine phosphatase, partial [Blastocatellia bacterium]